jgi:hypothetical protein
MGTMRRVALCAVVVMAGASGLIAASCSSSSSHTNTAHDGGDATTIYPELCMDLCTSQASSGTLVGTYADCLTQCCAMHPAGCPSMDSAVMGGGDSAMGRDTSVPPEDGGGEEGGQDGGCATPCGGHCCTSAEVCATNTCVPSCSGPTDCSGTAPCCAVQSNGQSGCVPATPDQECRCTTASDCSTGCCAPLTNAGGIAIGPYVCKGNTGEPYECCYGLFNDCGGNYCCISDSNNNEFCALPCSMNSMCSPGHCDSYDFGDTTTCSGSTACGP